MVNEITQFKYEQLDESTADFLRQKESNMRQIVGKAYTELGKELYEAQQELTGSRYDGVFVKWFTHLGWKQRTVYNLIDRYTELQKLQSGEEKELFEELPATLTYSISTPSAESTPEKAQAKAEVLAGEDATVKECGEHRRELERKAEQAERQTETARKERERREAENEELRKKEPGASSAEPYDRTMDFPYDVHQGNDFYAMLNDVDDLYKRYAHLKDGIEELRNIAKYDEDMQVKYHKANEYGQMMD